MLEALVRMAMVVLEHVSGHPVVLIAAIQLMGRRRQERRQGRGVGGAIVQVLRMQLLVRCISLLLQMMLLLLVTVVLVWMWMLVKMLLVLAGAIERRSSRRATGKQGKWAKGKG